ncbi:MAG: hypothetical protein RSA92_00285 [Bacteroidaceae bacterium]
MSKTNLNINKQFMIGNGILAFAVIFVVVLFVYMSMRLKSEKENGKQYSEVYNIELRSGFIGDSISVYVNDSLLFCELISKDSIRIDAKRFAEESALLVVDNQTDNISTFDLNNEGMMKENGYKIVLRKIGKSIQQE